MSRVAALPSGTMMGPFRIERPLSDVGGMAVVYEAKVADELHPSPKNKKVALKVARGDYHAAVHEKLLRRETAMLQQLRHPGIVRICPFSYQGHLPKDRWYGRKDESPDSPFFYAMELLEGDSLTKLIHSRDFKTFGPEWRVELLYQIALAVDYLHMRDLAHRDLKPDNILFRVKPDPGQVPQPVLIDLGLSEKREIRRQEEGGFTAATVAYASPTWIKSVRNSSRDDYTSRSEVIPNPLTFDMWSLGVIAYEVFNERYPFGTMAVERHELENRILAGQPERMSRIVPPGMQNIILRMLASQDGKRLTIEQFIQELETTSGYVSPRM